MTEREWLEFSDKGNIFDFLRTNASSRKLRLVAIADCYQFGAQLPEKCRPLLEVAERFADGLATEAELEEARHVASNLVEWYDCWLQNVRTEYYHQPPHGDEALISEIEDRMKPEIERRELILTAAMYTHSSTLPDGQLRDVGRGIIVPIVPECEQNFLRDIFGNPIDPMKLDPRWLTSTVVDLAGVIYKERAFERMPILADALMDAGCDSDAIINHCRDSGPHVRGCWVVDLLLGKT